MAYPISPEERALAAPTHLSRPSGCIAGPGARA
jgi:hypothetical protein